MPGGDSFNCWGAALAHGYGPWSTTKSAVVAFEATDSAPGVATLVSPLGSLAIATPSFAWNAVLGTSYYLLA